jgi:putative hydrolase of HD superfamily
MIDKLLALYRLKDEERAGWLLRGIERPESVADHSWGTALLCLLYAHREGVDIGRAVSIAVVHDSAEAVTGDIPARIDTSGAVVHAEGKSQREAAAVDELFPDGAADTEGVRALWWEYERAETKEARFVRDMNLIDMCLQALIYEADRRYDPAKKAENFPLYRKLDEFFATSEKRLSTAIGTELFRALHERYLSLS